MLEHAAEIRSLKNVNIIGLHLHIGSQIRELHVFENMCNKVNVIVENLEKLGCKFRFVDVGGGLGVNYDVPENEPIPTSRRCSRSSTTTCASATARCTSSSGVRSSPNAAS